MSESEQAPLQTKRRRNRRRNRNKSQSIASTRTLDIKELGGLPAIGVSNGSELQFAMAGPDGEFHFAAQGARYEDVIIGPGAMNPQDAARLIGQISPSLSVNYDVVEDNEYDDTLRGKDGMLVYHQMLTDGTISNALQYLYGSMRSAIWKMIPASMDGRDLEIAQKVKEQLGLDDSGVGKYAFSRLFTIYKNALVYGQAYGELVFQPGADNFVNLDKVIPIHPWAVEKIEYDKQGGPKDLVLTGTVKGTGEQIREKKVPIYKTVVFTHDDDGTFGGKSFLRAAVAHWRVKRSLVVLINQGMERFLLGVPVVKVPATVKPGTKQWDAARKMALDFISKPRTGIILQPNWEFEPAKLNVNMPDALPYLEYHDAAIARAMGIDWNTVRQTQAGDAANISDFIDITQQTIKTLLREFASIINLFLIPKLVLLNYPDVRNYPRIDFGEDRPEDFSASANLMGMLVNAALESLPKATPPSQNADGTTTPGTPGPTPEEITAVINALMDALPPRFKRALGIDELELAQGMSQYQTGASTAYRVDGRRNAPQQGPRQRIDTNPVRP